MGFNDGNGFSSRKAPKGYMKSSEDEGATGDQPDHYHAFGRVSRAPARVMIYIKRNVDKLKERFRVSEHPFGTIKFYDGAYFFLCKGKEKVAAETSLMFTSYNIRRAISLAGGVQT